MAKSKKFQSSIDMPLEQVHRIMASERYLLTFDEMESKSTAEIIDTELTTGEDGSARARVVARMTAQNNQTEEQSGDQEVAQAADTTAEAEIYQHTTVGPLTDQGFAMNSVMDLPRGMGKLTTDLQFTGDGHGGGCAVKAKVTADVGLPVVGGMMEKKLLTNADSTVESGLRRIERLAATE